jgi:hypothetical protein
VRIVNRLVRLPRSLRYALVAVIAFIIGGVGVVQAVEPARLSQIVNFAPNPDGTFNTAQVDGSHQVSVIDSGTQARLDTANRSLSQLQFDSAGNLKTAVNGTQQVSVNGTVAVRPAIPDKAISFSQFNDISGCGILVCTLAISQSDPVGTHYAINSVALSGFGSLGQFAVGAPATVKLEANCNVSNGVGLGAEVIVISAPAGQTVQLSFPQPVVLGGGEGQNCLVALFLNGSAGWIGVTGYKI